MPKHKALFFFSPFNTGVSSLLQVVVNLGLVYKVQHHSGVIFQFVAFIKKRKRTVPDIVAAGGRYDHLVGSISELPLSTSSIFRIKSKCFSSIAESMNANHIFHFKHSPLYHINNI